MWKKVQLLVLIYLLHIKTHLAFSFKINPESRHLFILTTFDHILLTATSTLYVLSASCLFILYVQVLFNFMNHAFFHYIFLSHIHISGCRFKNIKSILFFITITFILILWNTYFLWFMVTVRKRECDPEWKKSAQRSMITVLPQANDRRVACMTII